MVSTGRPLSNMLLNLLQLLLESQNAGRILGHEEWVLRICVSLLYQVGFWSGIHKNVRTIPAFHHLI